MLPDHSAADSPLKLLEYAKLDAAGFCLSADKGRVGLLGSPGRGGAGLNGWTTGLAVCPVLSLLDVLKEVAAGRLGLVDAGLAAGFGVLGGSGLYPAGRVDSGRGLVWGLGASMGLMVGFFSTVKGLGVSRGFGLGAGLLGSGEIIRA